MAYNVTCQNNKVCLVWQELEADVCEEWYCENPENFPCHLDMCTVEELYNRDCTLVQCFDTPSPSPSPSPAELLPSWAWARGGTAIVLLLVVAVSIGYLWGKRRQHANRHDQLLDSPTEQSPIFQRREEPLQPEQPVPRPPPPPRSSSMFEAGSLATIHRSRPGNAFFSRVQANSLPEGVELTTFRAGTSGLPLGNPEVPAQVVSDGDVALNIARSQLRSCSTQV
jgi:hypothetical protein